ncbi:MAG: hypothetical protein ACOCQX_02495 [Candidatus Nanoarchaeia archaeon]
MDIKSIKAASGKSLKSLFGMLPILVGVVFLIGAIKTIVPAKMYASVFGHSAFLDSVFGSAIGSIMAGNPITSYVLGGEFLAEGVSLLAVTAFIVAWVTVGIVQLPAESAAFGKKFAIIRNIMCFIFAILIAALHAWVYVWLMGVL